MSYDDIVVGDDANIDPDVVVDTLLENDELIDDLNTEQPDQNKEIVELRQELEKERKRYKSLQGMGNPRQLKAELDELRSVVTQLTVKPPEPPAPYKAELPASLKPLFDEHAPAMEAFISQSIGPVLDQLRHANAEIAELKKSQRNAPFNTLRALDTDGTFQSDDFQQFMKDTVDDLGLSLEDRIRSVSQVDPERGAQMMNRAKQSFRKQNQSQQPPARLQTQSKTIPLSQGSTSTTQTGGPKTKSQMKDKLENEYALLLDVPMTQEIVSKRAAIRVMAAKHGIQLDF